MQIKGAHDMKIRPKDRTSWQRWFAWHPILIGNDTVWLEIVERKRHPDIFDWVYSYRTIDRGGPGKYPRLWWTLGWRRLGEDRRFWRRRAQQGRWLEPLVSPACDPRRKIRQGLSPAARLGMFTIF